MLSLAGWESLFAICYLLLNRGIPVSPAREPAVPLPKYL